ncbi:uncharacterized protein N7459_008357 [Penicillium hispanicum]|uniref:uncharacterized protein n=1 Tax=Penicillium hispanicum TaxID=1080232 RepID=UPI0025406349|nr:uncharacterized protein N7459_008357 [Penicillium hispanicum]KAJ5573930.1 hypothetical protein N7459_008357 [Penicillium hispanicum]
MSDDDEYYDWDDDFMFEDVVPDLVDDLAGSAHHEAALYEDPGYEVEEYFSDWGYYSDDYYDDDPSVKPSTVRAKATGGVTKVRRTPSAAHLATRASRPQPDLTTFQSVVWKTASMEEDQDLAVEIYEPGNGEKLAFLANWREIFKSAQPALDKSRLRQPRVARTIVEDPSLADDDTFADDESGHDEDDQLDSSDEMANVLSSHLVKSRHGGDGSNATLELSQSPMDTPEEDSIPAGRGRKRKAEVPAMETNQNNTGGSSKRALSKRVALDSGNGDRTKFGGSPVRRSARQKN